MQKYRKSDYFSNKTEKTSRKTDIQSNGTFYNPTEKSIKLSDFYHNVASIKNQNKTIKYNDIIDSNKTQTKFKKSNIIRNLANISKLSKPIFPKQKTYLNPNPNSGKQKLQVVNKYKSRNFLQQEEKNNWFQPINNFFTSIFPKQDGCSCQQPCQWAQIMLNWSKKFRKVNKNDYQNIKKYKLQSKVIIQIQKDINRTQSEVQSFQNQRFQHLLKSILMNYAKYDMQVNYVQGMNLIASIIIYHVKTQEDSFWLFTSFMQNLNLRKLFLNDFQECFRHLDIIRQKLKINVFDLYQHLTKCNIQLSPICFSWILTIFTCLVKIEFAHYIYLGLVKGGWPYIYRLTIIYLTYLKKQIMRTYDQCQIMVYLSTSYARSTQVNWKSILEQAEKSKF